ncbi:hypothetical protein CYLTODRAFT_138144 [Cylindrobasidium torrendii FP15055 ss-10]|uniref:Zn(2)-C6 fungal-type domain-containing protein n=1 Tax=Cylindrobasidium torrendii FP15055 ss-10 TaxID=1314674 RepID=A0A0D7AZR4_9AGAR|nr:hypothetical protein CYLTODRAFT_138144 [Cylindrobasidium torrendii FP15055 ss-10]
MSENLRSESVLRHGSHAYKSHSTSVYPVYRSSHISPAISAVPLITMSRVNYEDLTPILDRGQACIHCRRKKMRCDGAHPVCGPCSRTTRPTDCEYTDKQGRTRAEILEENIARVEARIFELEHPNAYSHDPIYLHNPYQQQPPPATFDTGKDPTPELKIYLVDRVLQYTSETSFFLNPKRFRASFVGHGKKAPIPALVSAVYLWGAHLSGDATLRARREEFLAQAVAKVATSLSSSHPNRVLQTLQTELLLATYFYGAGRCVEGKYHLSTGASIAIAAGLKKVRSASVGSRPMTGLDKAEDAINEGEQIDAFWTTLALDQMWTVALAAPTNFICLADRTTVVDETFDTPCPLETEQYEKGGYPRDLVSRRTVLTFLDGQPAGVGGSAEYSSKSVVCKAAMLWFQASVLIGSWRPDMSPSETQSFSARFATLNANIEQLRLHLVAPAQLRSAPRSAFVAHNLVCAAFLQLHGMFGSREENTQSRQTILNAARHTFQLLVNLNVSAMTKYVNPIIGTVWMSASQVLFEELARMKGQRPKGLRPGKAEYELQQLTDAAIKEMEALKDGSTLLSYQVSRIREAYAAPF